MADSILELEVRQKHTADTKDAEAAVQRLENANKKLELSYKNIDFSSSESNKGLVEGSKAASTAIGSVESAANKLAPAIKAAGETGATFGNQVNKGADAAEVGLKNVQKTATQTEGVFKRLSGIIKADTTQLQGYLSDIVTGYSAKLTGVWAIQRWSREAMNIATTTDAIRASMIRIDGIDAMNRAFEDGSKIAHTYNAKITDVLTTMTELMRQGKSAEVASDLAKAMAETRLMLATSTGKFISMTDIMEKTTGLMQQLNLNARETTDAMKYMTEMDVRTATSFDKISAAMVRFAATGKMARLTTTDMIDAASALSSAGFTGEETGTALNTILSRVGRNAESLDFMRKFGVSMFETKDGVTTLNSSLQMLLKTYEAVKNQGSYLDMSEFLELFAGTRMQSKLLALLDNYQDQADIRTNAKISMFEFDETKAATIGMFLDTIASKQEALYNAFSTSFISADFVSSVKDGLDTIGSMVGGFASTTLTTIGSFIGGLGAPFAAISKLWGNTQSTIEHGLDFLATGFQVYWLAKFPSMIASVFNKIGASALNEIATFTDMLQAAGNALNFKGVKALPDYSQILTDFKVNSENIYKLPDRLGNILNMVNGINTVLQTSGGESKVISPLNIASFNLADQSANIKKGLDTALSLALMEIEGTTQERFKPTASKIAANITDILGNEIATKAVSKNQIDTWSDNMMEILNSFEGSGNFGTLKAYDKALKDISKVSDFKPTHITDNLKEALTALASDSELNSKSASIANNIRTLIQSNLSADTISTEVVNSWKYCIADILSQLNDLKGSGLSEAMVNQINSATKAVSAASLDMSKFIFPEAFPGKIKQLDYFKEDIKQQLSEVLLNINKDPNLESIAKGIPIKLADMLSDFNLDPLNTESITKFKQSLESIMSDISNMKGDVTSNLTSSMSKFSNLELIPSSIPDDLDKMASQISTKFMSIQNMLSRQVALDKGISPLLEKLNSYRKLSPEIAKTAEDIFGSVRRAISDASSKGTLVDSNVYANVKTQLDTFKTKLEEAVGSSSYSEGFKTKILNTTSSMLDPITEVYSNLGKNKDIGTLPDYSKLKESLIERFNNIRLGLNDLSEVSVNAANTASIFGELYRDALETSLSSPQGLQRIKDKLAEGIEGLTLTRDELLSKLDSKQPTIKLLDDQLSSLQNIKTSAISFDFDYLDVSAKDFGENIKVKFIAAAKQSLSSVDALEFLSEPAMNIKNSLAESLKDITPDTLDKQSMDNISKLLDQMGILITKDLNGMRGKISEQISKTFSDSLGSIDFAKGILNDNIPMDKFDFNAPLEDIKTYQHDLDLLNQQFVALGDNLGDVGTAVKSSIDSALTNLAEYKKQLELLENIKTDKDSDIKNITYKNLEALNAAKDSFASSMNAVQATIFNTDNLPKFVNAYKSSLESIIQTTIEKRANIQTIVSSPSLNIKAPELVKGLVEADKQLAMFATNIRNTITEFDKMKLTGSAAIESMVGSMRQLNQESSDLFKNVDSMTDTLTKSTKSWGSVIMDVGLKFLNWVSIIMTVISYARMLTGVFESIYRWASGVDEKLASMKANAEIFKEFQNKIEDEQVKVKDQLQNVKVSGTGVLDAANTLSMTQVSGMNLDLSQKSEQIMTALINLLQQLKVKSAYEDKPISDYTSPEYLTNALKGVIQGTLKESQFLTEDIISKITTIVGSNLNTIGTDKFDPKLLTDSILKLIYSFDEAQLKAFKEDSITGDRYKNLSDALNVLSTTLSENTEQLAKYHELKNNTSTDNSASSVITKLQEVIQTTADANNDKQQKDNAFLPLAIKVMMEEFSKTNLERSEKGLNEFISNNLKGFISDLTVAIKEGKAEEKNKYLKGLSEEQTSGLIAALTTMEKTSVTTKETYDSINAINSKSYDEAIKYSNTMLDGYRGQLKTVNQIGREFVNMLMNVNSLASNLRGIIKLTEFGQGLTGMSQLYAAPLVKPFSGTIKEILAEAGNFFKSHYSAIDSTKKAEENIKVAADPKNVTSKQSEESAKALDVTNNVLKEATIAVREAAAKKGVVFNDKDTAAWLKNSEQGKKLTNALTYLTKEMQREAAVRKSLGNDMNSPAYKESLARSESILQQYKSIQDILYPTSEKGRSPRSKELKEAKDAFAILKDEYAISLNRLEEEFTMRTRKEDGKIVEVLDMFNRTKTPEYFDKRVAAMEIYLKNLELLLSKGDARYKADVEKAKSEVEKAIAQEKYKKLVAEGELNITINDASINIFKQKLKDIEKTGSDAVKKSLSLDIVQKEIENMKISFERVGMGKEGTPFYSDIKAAIDSISTLNKDMSYTEMTKIYEEMSDKIRNILTDNKALKDLQPEQIKNLERFANLLQGAADNARGIKKAFQEFNMEMEVNAALEKGKFTRQMELDLKVNTYGQSANKALDSENHALDRIKDLTDALAKIYKDETMDKKTRENKMYELMVQGFSTIGTDIATEISKYQQHSNPIFGPSSTDISKMEEDIGAKTKQMTDKIMDALIKNLKEQNIEINETMMEQLKMTSSTMAKKIADAQMQAAIEASKKMAEDLQKWWDMGFNIGLSKGFTKEGYEELYNSIIDTIAREFSNRISKVINQAISDGLKSAFANMNIDENSFGGQLLGMFGGILGGILSSVIGFFIGGLFNKLKKQQEDMVKQQKEAQRDRVTASGFNWSYREAEKATPYAEYSPPITQESVKIVKFQNTFNITTDAARALMADRRELERIITEIIINVNRTMAKTVGTRV